MTPSLPSEGGDRAGSPAVPAPVVGGPADRLMIVGAGRAASVEEFAAAVRAGLTDEPKRLDCTWLYDAEGSRLFERITTLPEYYPTRAEQEILERNAHDILGDVPPDLTLVELGSGSAAKTRVLIEELLGRNGTLEFVPIDISRSMLEQSSRELLVDHPGLEVHGIAMQYADGLHEMRRAIPGPKLVLWLGSSIGNLERARAAEFLRAVRADLDPSDRFLLGVDLRKDRETLQRAYDDAEGVTALFNKNLLERVNRELGGGFDADAFEHRAVYREDAGRVETHLVSTRDQSVHIALLDLSLDFGRGETIHTESSYKYSPDEIEQLVEAGGFELGAQWFDGGERVSLNRLVPTT